MNMKMTNIAAVSVLILGLSTAVYAEGMGKCGGGMMMKGDFTTVKSRMLQHIGEMQKCVEAATSKQDLKKCRMKMMQKRKQMMQQTKPAVMQCGAGRCGGGK